MPLYSVLPTPPSVKELATVAASLLGTSSWLKDIKKVTTKVQRMELFHYTWVYELKNLADEIAKTMPNHVQSIVQKVGVKIRKIASDKTTDEKDHRLAVLILRDGWIKLENSVAIVLPLPLSSEEFKKDLPHVSEEIKTVVGALQASYGVNPVLHLRSVDRKDYCTLDLELGSNILVFGSVEFRIFPTVPFLMWSLPTVSAPVEG